MEGPLGFQSSFGDPHAEVESPASYADAERSPITRPEEERNREERTNAHAELRGIATILAGRDAALSERLHGIIARLESGDAAFDALLGAMREDRDAALRRSQIDALTGLRNVEGLNIALAHLITEQNQHLRSGEKNAGVQRLAFLYVDLDHFKPINDRLGHEAGDIYLKTAAAHMRNVFRHDDVVARKGGDEFAIAFVAASVTKIVEKAREVRDAVEAASIAAREDRRVIARINSLPVEGREVAGRISASIGCAIYSTERHGDAEAAAAALMRDADGALYAAKNAGRNQVALTGYAHALLAREAGVDTDTDSIKAA